jgi:putative inorganic carbon (hco3(-)) transporter
VGRIAIRRIAFQMPSELIAETAEQPPKAGVKRRNRRKPLGFAYFGLVLFMVVYFARPEDWIPGLAALPLAKISGILILVALAFSFSSIRWHMPLEVTFLALLVVQLWLSAAFSPVWRGGAVNLMLDFSKVLPLFIVIYGAVRSMNRLGWILFVQAASVAAIAVASIVSSHTLGGRLQSVLSGMSGDPNDLAVLIDLTLPLCLALALTTRSLWKKFAWTITMLAMIYAVVLTASRAGALALAVVSLICVWKLGAKSRRLYLILLVPIAMIAFWVYAGSVLRARFDQGDASAASRGQSGEASASAQQRKELLLQSLKITAQHPLLGVGPGNFEFVSGFWHVTHNSYTQMSAEGGIPALLLYLLLFWRSIVNLRKVNRYSATTKAAAVLSMTLQASLAGYLVGSFFLSLGYHLFPYCLLAYTSALRLIESRKHSESNSAVEAVLAPAQPEAEAWV